jgi:hypothetical protein
MKNILIYPSDTEEAEELKRALGKMVHFRLFEISDTESLKTSFDNVVGHVLLNSTRFVSEISELIERYQIDFIYPASQEAVIQFSKYADHFQATILAPSYDTCMICRTVDLLNNVFSEILPVNTAAESSFNQQGSNYIVSCLTDNNRTLRFIGVLNQENNKIFRDNHIPEVNKIAYEINEKLKILGAWSFKLKKSVSEALELNQIHFGIIPEMEIYRINGVNLASLSLFTLMGKEIEIKEINLPFDIERRAMRRRYAFNYEYEDIYFDLDDTLIIRDRINENLIAFLFQCRNQGKRVHLITKHKYDLPETLKKFRIDQLFDSIIWLKMHEQKYLHINSEKAIFIDDAFSERKSVTDKLGIPTFEVSAIESLIECRI